MKIRDKVELHPVYDGKIKELFKEKFPDAYVECTDNKYYTCDVETFRKIASLMPYKHIKYKSEEFDCENYALAFWSTMKLLFPRLPVGYMHVNTPTGKHALNFIVYRTEAGNFYFTMIEPQENKVTYFAGYKPYLVLV